MTILRPGVTGFNTQSDVDFRAFRKAVYDAVQTLSAIVVDTVEACGVTPNFHVAHVVYRKRNLGVVCNRHFPVIAFVEHPVEMSGVRAFDVPEFADYLREAGFEVASAAELERLLEPRDFESLTDAERAQARYWKPQRVGDLVFNWWD